MDPEVRMDPQALDLVLDLSQADAVIDLRERQRRASTVTGLLAARRWQLALKRTVDIVGSAFGLILLSPLLLVAAVAVKASSPGPVVYVSERVGRRGRPFRMVKFRSMIHGAHGSRDHHGHLNIHDSGPVFKIRDDPRVTRVGRLLRRCSIDELPQLWNVLRGDMSLVGPRPERAFFIERHKALQGVRLAVKPGLTGLAQVRSYYDLKPAHKVKYDYLYIQNRSFFLNLYILLQTIPVLFEKKGW